MDMNAILTYEAPNGRPSLLCRKTLEDIKLLQRQRAKGPGIDAAKLVVAADPISPGSSTRNANEEAASSELPSAFKVEITPAQKIEAAKEAFIQEQLEKLRSGLPRKSDGDIQDAASEQRVGSSENTSQERKDSTSSSKSTSQEFVTMATWRPAPRVASTTDIMRDVVGKRDAATSDNSRPLDDYGESGVRWLTGLVEVPLSIEDKIKNIERTEKALRELERKRSASATSGSSSIDLRGTLGVSNYNANFNEIYFKRVKRSEDEDERELTSSSVASRSGPQHHHSGRVPAASDSKVVAQFIKHDRR